MSGWIFSIVTIPKFRSAFCLVACLALTAIGPISTPRAGQLPDCTPHEPPVTLDDDRVLLLLGRDLFYDPILSGNRTVACATCHHSALATTDSVALTIGDGGIGIGRRRRADAENLPERRIPRNTQSLFNLGFPEFSVLFFDGRVERLDDGTIRTPLGTVRDQSALGVLIAQAAFPVISADEMAGHYSENDVAKAVRRGVLTGHDGAYEILANRVRSIEAYRKRFEAANNSSAPIEFTDIAHALAAFQAYEWRADNSPFDRFLCFGEKLSERAASGMNMFYGKAGCSSCHSGRFQTDHRFHAIAMPQFGPGKVERFETHARDTGRMRVTGDPDDAYRFRTPSLRNVVHTAPYGHSGAYADLEQIIRHHLDPLTAFRQFDRTSVVLPALPGADDFQILNVPGDLSAIAAANRLRMKNLSDEEIELLIAFLDSLTDPVSLEGRLGVPDKVPSGLPVPQP